MGRILTVAHEMTSATHAHPFFERSMPQLPDRGLVAEAHKAWNALGKEAQKAAGGRTAFLESRGIVELSPPARNTRRLKEESGKRLAAGFDRTILPLAPASATRSAIEVLASLESVELLGELYAFQKKAIGLTETRNSGLAEDVRVSIRNCLRQGRELYLTGLGGGLIAKPLSHFYAMTAYSYATAVMCNPNHHSIDTLPGSHGVEHHKDDQSLQFGGDSPRGTFSELHGGLTTNYVPVGRSGIALDLSESVLEFHATRVTTSLRTLLSMVPEIRQFFRLATGEPSRTHQMKVNSDVGEVEFQIGDGERTPASELLASAFPAITPHNRDGRTVVRLRHGELGSVRACIYADVAGDTWYIDNPFDKIVLPEVCLHYLIMSALSTIMRYRPRLWGEVLLNEVDSAEALLLRQYFLAFEDKFPILMLRVLSKYFPVVGAPSR